MRRVISSDAVRSGGPVAAKVGGVRASWSVIGPGAGEILDYCRGMGNIGEERRRIEVLPAPAPVPEPATPTAPAEPAERPAPAPR
jgi:hypothetical protein